MSLPFIAKFLKMNVTQQIVNAIWLGGVYSLFALGYALVFSVLGVLNLAHSAVFRWGAFIGLAAVTQLNLSIWLAVPIAMVGAGLIGVVLDAVAFAPLRRRNAPRCAFGYSVSRSGDVRAACIGGYRSLR